MMHIVGNIWNAIISIRNEWVITLDFKFAGVYPLKYHYFERSDSYRYIACLYTSLIFLGGGEMGPRTDIDMVVVPIIQIILSIFNAWLFGDMAVLSEISGRK